MLKHGRNPSISTKMLPFGWGVPSATQAAITAFTVDRHNAMLHHVAQRATYHPGTLAWQRRFLGILANRRHATPSGASSAGVPYYSLTFPYQENEWISSVSILCQQLARRTKTGTTTIRDLVPTFLTNSHTSAAPGDRGDSPRAAAYRIALGAKHINQASCITGAAIAAGCTRVTRRLSKPADNGLSAGHSTSFEHAFLEDVCYPAYRIFDTSISCTTYGALSHRSYSYAGRALLPCLERTAKECHGSFVNARTALCPALVDKAYGDGSALRSSIARMKHAKHDHCLQLAIFLSVGILHSPRARGDQSTSPSPRLVATLRSARSSWLEARAGYCCFQLAASSHATTAQEPARARVHSTPRLTIIA